MQNREWIRMEKGIQRKPWPVFAVFQVPITQNNQYAEAVYLGVACPELYL